jgi:FAD:protein FMN transferase
MVISGLFILFFMKYSATWYTFSGETMGTTYSIKVKAPRYLEREKVEEKINFIFSTYNSIFSTYDSSSEISKVNAFNSPAPMEISEDLFEMLLIGKSMFKQTKGAWDGSVYPLVDLWNLYTFNTDDSEDGVIPSESDILKTLHVIGYDKFIVYREMYKYMFKKDRVGFKVDLSSIVKGATVDRVAQYLQSVTSDFMVEIGGEVYASGMNSKSKNWTFGVKHPLYKEGGSFPLLIDTVELDGAGMATSGDYERYHMIDGKRYSHILDPRTGYPVSHGIISVTVVSPSTAYSDGLATALMVMSYEEGRLLIDSLEAVTAYWVVSNFSDGKAGVPHVYFSNNWSPEITEDKKISK